jgi:hypothetical protein
LRDENGQQIDNSIIFELYINYSKRWNEPYKKIKFLVMRSKSCITFPLRYPDNYRDDIGRRKKKVNKGVWRMPWLLEAMKDVISCDKLGVLANTN